jgi:hypothetical protein
MPPILMSETWWTWHFQQGRTTRKGNTGIPFFFKLFFYKCIFLFLDDNSDVTFSAKTCTPGACQRETCHGLDITCGSNPPDVCTAMYQIGDKCLQYAQCGVRNGTCGQVENTSFTQCKTCVQNCIDKNKDNSEKLFECESKC